MEEQQQTKFQKLNNFFKTNLTARKNVVRVFVCILFVVFSIVLVFIIFYQVDYEKNTEEQLASAQEKELELQEKVASRKAALSIATQKYVEETGAKPCIILCFDDFGESAYTSVIETMDKYGFVGVIVFRDGKVPGTNGSISVELYQELLDKGWEGAIGNSENIRVYNNFPEIRKEKWSEYITEMQNAFVKNGLEVPTVYIPHENEVLMSVQDLLMKYNMKIYTRIEETVEEAATGMQAENFTEMGMIIGKYDYKILSTDIQTIALEAESMSILFKRVEYGAPRDNQHTSVYMFTNQLERLSMLSEYVNVTTFSGYEEYQQQIIKDNDIIYQNYLVERNALRAQIKSLEDDIAENYAEIFD